MTRPTTFQVRLTFWLVLVGFFGFVTGLNWYQCEAISGSNIPNAQPLTVEEGHDKTRQIVTLGLSAESAKPYRNVVSDRRNAPEMVMPQTAATESSALIFALVGVFCVYQVMQGALRAGTQKGKGWRLLLTAAVLVFVVADTAIRTPNAGVRTVAIIGCIMALCRVLHLQERRACQEGYVGFKS